MTSLKRHAIIAANWKMHKTLADTRNFIRKLVPLITDPNATVFIAVPFTSLETAAMTSSGTSIFIGAQNMNDCSSGAFTGEVSGEMLKDAGAEFVLLGHSERRRIFGENNGFINRKIKHAIELGLQPILCIGETQAEKDKDLAEKILKQQLQECLKDLDSARLDKLILAYEPVWAIGTGLTATPEEAQKRHTFCRELLGQLFNQKVGQTTPILYGGSVNPSNIGSLMKLPDVDGVLVGGASLSVDTFSLIINYQTTSVTED